MQVSNVNKPTSTEIITLPQITTNTVTVQGRPEFEFIVEPAIFATLWKDITGRAVVTEADLSNIKALAQFFESGLAITRNNRTDTTQPSENEISNFNAFIEQYLPEYSGSPISERAMDMLDAVRDERSDVVSLVADYYNRNR